MENNNISTRVQRANYLNNLFYDENTYGYYLKSQMRFISFVLLKIDSGLDDQEILKILKTIC